MIIKPLLRMVTLFAIVAFSRFTLGIAQEPVVVPDFTKGAKIPPDARHDWNLGPTGLRGWIFCDRLVTTDARQILITKVDKGSPAADTIRAGDVILGVGGKPFSFDPRTELGQAITTAETKAANGKLALTRWRAGKSDEVVINLGVRGSYATTAPFDCDKSKLLLEQGCKALAARFGLRQHGSDSKIAERTRFVGQRESRVPAAGEKGSPMGVSIFKQVDANVVLRLLYAVSL